MNLSPFQLLDSKIIKVEVEQNSENPLSNGGEVDFPRPMEEFQIDQMAHIELRPTKSSGKGQTQDGLFNRTYFVMLGLRTTTETAKKLPYEFEIVVTGVMAAIDIDGKTEEEKNNMAAQYGYSLLYGQIREILSGLTSRMRWGNFILPTINFMDAKYESEKKAAVPEKASS